MKLYRSLWASNSFLKGQAYKEGLSSSERNSGLPVGLLQQASRQLTRGTKQVYIFQLCEKVEGLGIKAITKATGNFYVK